MSVYVDQLFKTPKAYRKSKRAAWWWERACHMWADSLEELHEMADRIGLKRQWCQTHTDPQHYDLTATKRAAALRAGALEGNLREYFRQKRRRMSGAGAPVAESTRSSDSGKASRAVSSRAAR